MIHNKLLLYLVAITIATLFNGLAHGAAARELQSALPNNWDINFLSFTADLNPNGDIIASEFEIGKDQVFDVEIFAADCITPIIGSPITLNGDPTRTNKNDNHDIIRIAHTITKGALIGSNIWNGTENKLEICQKTKLVLKVDLDPANDMVVVEDRRKFTVVVDFLVDFEVNSTLAKNAGQAGKITKKFETKLKTKKKDGNRRLQLSSENRTLVYSADMLRKTMVQLIGQSLPPRGELGGVTPLSYDECTNSSNNCAEEGTGQNEYVFPNPLPDWEAVRRFRRELTITTTEAGAEHEEEGERELQATSNSSNFKFEVTLLEPCDNETHCSELMNTTTMYDDVTGFINQEIENGNFTALLQENVAMYPLTTRRRMNQVAQTDATLAIEAGAEDDGFDDLASASAVTLGIMHDHPRENGQRKLSEFLDVTGASHSPPVATIEVIEVQDTQVFNVSGSTDVISYVRACKCGGWESFTCNSDVLEENGELNICISSIIPLEVETDFIESMIINQAGQASLDVIKDKNVEFTSLTSIQYDTNQDGIAVSTRVPNNMFSFGGGNAITITGGVRMKLAGGSRRKLQISLASDGAFSGDASFQLKVKLGSKQLSSQGVLKSSASNVAADNRLVIMFGMVFGLTFSMIW